MKNEQFPRPQNIREKYISKADEHGYVYLRTCREEFDGRQIKSIASLLDGSEGINLGINLKFQGDSGNYPDIKINIDDLETFIDRVRNHYGQ